MIYEDIADLLFYAKETNLLADSDEMWARNMLLSLFSLDSFEESAPKERELCDILDSMCEYAKSEGIIEDGIVAHDLFDTKIMGILTPRPSEVERTFSIDYSLSPELATYSFYKFCGDCNYIRRDRIARDLKWETDTPYGTLEITINLSKPEKDPKAIAAALKNKNSSYPKCQLCCENVGYAGRLDHPARENLRVIPLNLAGEAWSFQYSPYVYYNEHCIVLSDVHRPMKIDRGTFERTTDFVTQFPQYFVGSNADLPIVGGSILTHDHFQGGNHLFPMMKAPIETPLCFKDYPDIEAGIVLWPMSVIRLVGERERIIDLADVILNKWRAYSDPDADIYAVSDDTEHNTITPIAYRRDEKYVLDLVLRNNITTDEHPMGLFHPHEELHHIKKENIGLIEVMGLAVLPSRLKGEMKTLSDAILEGRNIEDDETLAKHAPWANAFLEARKGDLESAENKQEALENVIRDEIGKVFMRVLEDAGVYKRTEEGKEAFLRFTNSIDD